MPYFLIPFLGFNRTGGIRTAISIFVVSQGWRGRGIYINYGYGEREHCIVYLTLESTSYDDQDMLITDGVICVMAL